MCVSHIFSPRFPRQWHLRRGRVVRLFVILGFHPTAQHHPRIPRSGGSGTWGMTGMESDLLSSDHLLVMDNPHFYEVNGPWMAMVHSYWKAKQVSFVTQLRGNY